MLQLDQLCAVFVTLESVFQLDLAGLDLLDQTLQLIDRLLKTRCFFGAHAEEYRKIATRHRDRRRGLLSARAP